MPEARGLLLIFCDCPGFCSPSHSRSIRYLQGGTQQIKDGSSAPRSGAALLFATEDTEGTERFFLILTTVPGPSFSSSSSKTEDSSQESEFRRHRRRKSVMFIHSTTPMGVSKSTHSPRPRPPCSLDLSVGYSLSRFRISPPAGGCSHPNPRTDCLFPWLPTQNSKPLPIPLSQLKPQNFERKVNEEIRNIRKKEKILTSPFQFS